MPAIMATADALGSKLPNPSPAEICTDPDWPAAEPELPLAMETLPASPAVLSPVATSISPEREDDDPLAIRTLPETPRLSALPTVTTPLTPISADPLDRSSDASNLSAVLTSSNTSVDEPPDKKTKPPSTLALIPSASPPRRNKLPEVLATLVESPP